MEVLSIQFAGDARVYHLITECKESDTCPGCGASYKAGFSECEYCHRPVQSGDCWQVISGPDVGKLVPMTDEEAAIKPAWKWP